MSDRSWSEARGAGGARSGKFRLNLVIQILYGATEIKASGDLNMLVHSMLRGVAKELWFVVGGHSPPDVGD
jgi:hypothetical protein